MTLAGIVETAHARKLVIVYKALRVCRFRDWKDRQVMQYASNTSVILNNMQAMQSVTDTTCS